ncbi:MAG: SpoIID/LytB domain-containing protein [Propionicimonas sp.]|nr:SpoIID/LytB domain-containing protein [Propionicimonas sp.]
MTATNSTLTITTAGWGHGRGMSQYGAQAAAKQGLSYSKILGFYYPGTKLESLGKNDTVRVWITADTDNKLHVYPATGLRVRDSAGKTFTLPTGKNYTKWRISRSGSKRVLYYRDAKGKYRKYTNSKFKLDPKRVWYFDNTKTGTVKLYLASGNRTYRGSLALRFYGSGARTVNNVSMENYLRSVVPSEMPASWNAEALKAQTVAARTYAARYRANLGGKQVYDICNTAACQVYKGTMTEYSASDAAVKATEGKVLTYDKKYAWTEFSSSNGGYSVKGSYAYIKAQEDPYDASTNQVWSTPVKTSTIEKKYTKIGTLKSITLERDGKGRWGGRVTQVTLTGTKGTQKVSGTSFKSALGLRETLMTISGGLATNSGNYTRWQADFGGSKGALLGVPAGTEQVRSGGLYAPFEGGALWWSKATGSHRLSAAANAAYLQAGGPEKSGLGFPKTDEYAFTKKIVDDFTPATRVDFEVGMILCKANAKAATDCLVSLG